MTAKNTPGWHIAVDRGGTFTDIVATRPGEAPRVLKLLSESHEYGDAVLEGVRSVIGKDTSDPIEEVRLGTTIATNALLERRGERVALVTTCGFEDAVEIGRQTRPRLFDLAIRKPELLYGAVIGIRERVAADGTVVVALDETHAERELRRLAADGYRSLAVAFVHAWTNPEHERRIESVARDIGFAHVSCSHAMAASIGYVERARATLVDAYTHPVLHRYLASVRAGIGARLVCMQNSGGLTTADRFRGKDALLSGPAGGVVGCAAVARELGLVCAIGFDMGGTSTDVSRFAGALEMADEASLGGVEFRSPMLRVETIAAGGGSLLRFDGHRLTVGPESAGAIPGPACYGRGGPLAITDANVVLGRVRPEFLPRTFGETGSDALHAGEAQSAMEELAADVSRRGERAYDAATLGLGFVRIANEMMARPIRELTVARGHDVRDHALVAFGGAAGQHAAEIADLLGVRTVVIPANASVLSAWGIARARQSRTATRSILREWTDAEAARIAAEFEEAAAPLVAELRDVGIAPDCIATDRLLLLRTRGVDHAIEVEFGDDGAVRRRFAESHREHFGFAPGAGAIEVAAIRVVVRGTTEDHSSPVNAAMEPGFVNAPVRVVDVRFDDGVCATPVVAREAVGERPQPGPALVVEEHTTTVVPPGWTYRRESGHLLLERTGSPRVAGDERRDPVLLEVFNHLFMSVAEQMGAVLAATAHSANIRERHDFSCAVFDARGDLVANAPHIPVHLGAMGDTVRAIAQDLRATWRPGDVYLTNNPYRGGSHLPDITAVTPIFAENETEPAFFVAGRGHHADIGGRTPGSFPPDATRLDEEGVLLDGLLAVRDGVFLDTDVRAALLHGPHPAREIDERLSDLRAQIAANARGERELRGLVERYGLGVVRAYMGHLQDNAAEAIEDALRGFVRERREFFARFADALDDGTPIAVSIAIRRDGEGDNAPVRAEVDFTGTGAPHAQNLNAPLAVTRAAVLYVLRLLVTRDIPLNDGCWRPVTLVVPENSVLNPSPGAAVVGGNVETSQRVVDVLLGSLGITAASQGTMNNLLFGANGGDGRPYYETIAGGSGATANADGASAVQVHLTNTRITDVEVLEHRFPEVRVERFAVRRRSGGEGRHRGGDGIVRALRFFAPRLVTIFSERRVRAPFGLAGGEPGAPGHNTLIRDGERIELPGRVTIAVHAGDVIEIETPGGGGFGTPFAS